MFKDHKKTAYLFSKITIPFRLVFFIGIFLISFSFFHLLEKSDTLTSPEQGTLTFSNGTKYTGEIKNGFANGIGIHYCPEGQYEGEFKDNKYNGQGTLYYSNGNTYIGEWKDSNAHGQGTFKYANGKVDKGIWKKGRLIERQ